MLRIYKVSRGIVSVLLALSIPAFGSGGFLEDNNQELLERAAAWAGMVSVVHDSNAYDFMWTKEGIPPLCLEDREIRGAYTFLDKCFFQHGSIKQLSYLYAYESREARNMLKSSDFLDANIGSARGTYYSDKNVLCYITPLPSDEKVSSRDELFYWNLVYVALHICSASLKGRMEYEKLKHKGRMEYEKFKQITPGFPEAFYLQITRVLARDFLQTFNAKSLRFCFPNRTDAPVSFIQLACNLPVLAQSLRALRYLVLNPDLKPDDLLGFHPTDLFFMQGGYANQSNFERDLKEAVVAIQGCRYMKNSACVRAKLIESGFKYFTPERAVYMRFSLNASVALEMKDKPCITVDSWRVCTAESHEWDALVAGEPLGNQVRKELSGKYGSNFFFSLLVYTLTGFKKEAGNNKCVKMFLSGFLASCIKKAEKPFAVGPFGELLIDSLEGEPSSEAVIYALAYSQGYHFNEFRRHLEERRLVRNECQMVCFDTNFYLRNLTSSLNYNTFLIPVLWDSVVPGFAKSLLYKAGKQDNWIHEIAAFMRKQAIAVGGGKALMTTYISDITIPPDFAFKVKCAERQSNLSLIWENLAKSPFSLN